MARGERRRRVFVAGRRDGARAGAPATLGRHRAGGAAGDLLLVGFAHARRRRSCSRWRCCPRSFRCSRPSGSRRSSLGFYLLGRRGRAAADPEPARQPRGEALHRPELLRQPLRLPPRVGAGQQRARATDPRREDICRQIETLVCTVFDAERAGDLPARRAARGRSAASTARPAMPAHDRLRQPAAARVRAIAHSRSCCATWRATSI